MRRGIILSFLLISISSSPITSFAAEEVNLYSSRQVEFIKPLLDRFSILTGIKVNLISKTAPVLLQQLKKEDMNTPADLFLTTDAGRLHKAHELGLLQKVHSKKLNTAIPSEFRHPEGYWFGLSIRARAFFYNKSKVKVEELSRYEALAEDKWKNRLCIRSSTNIYNQSLLASMIAYNGEEQAQTWANKVVDNMARDPEGGDRNQIKSAALGYCDVAIANTYYYGQMIHNPKDKPLADKVAIFWPNQKDRGTHVNISGIGMTMYAKNKENAQLLMEFLVTQESQNWYAQVNHEYPVIVSAKWSGTLKGWGYFHFDPLNTAKLGQFNDDAMRVMQAAGWK